MVDTIPALKIAIYIYSISEEGNYEKNIFSLCVPPPLIRQYVLMQSRYYLF
jgi:hypothetical protein